VRTSLSIYVYIGKNPIIRGKRKPVLNGCCKLFFFCRNKVAACAKHFVGDGGTQNGINENNTIIDRRGLMNIHMPAYFDSLRKGVSTVMISYSSWNGEKMHANHDLITRFLKGRLNFKVKNLSDADACVSLVGIPLSSDAHSYVFFCVQGFTISDWEGIDRITSPPGANYSYSVQASILAGIDMVSHSAVLKLVIDTLHITWT
jgi:beta-glucosidase-like glycosyl hydrolase